MRRYSLALAISIALLSTLTIGALAGSRTSPDGLLGLIHQDSTKPSTSVRNFTASPFEFDPTQSGIVVGDWVRHLGLADEQSNQRFGLRFPRTGQHRPTPRPAWSFTE